MKDPALEGGVQEYGVTLAVEKPLALKIGAALDKEWQVAQHG
jgi:hypothetical protein